MKKLERMMTNKDKILERILEVTCFYDQDSPRIKFKIKYKYIPKLINDLVERYNNRHKDAALAENIEE